MTDLARRLARGERTAFAELYDRLHARLFRYLATRLESRESAADVLQEVFMRLARSSSRLGAAIDLDAYVFGVARNEAARHMSRHAGRSRLVVSTDAIAALSTGPETRSDDADFAREALRSLSAERREVVELRIYGELTFREIAETLRLPQGTIATRYRDAITQLRARFAEEPR